MLFIRVIYFVLLLFITSNYFGQHFADKNRYLVDSLDLSVLEPYEYNLVDSCINVFHSVDADTSKANAILHIVAESWDYNVWPRYNRWLHEFISKKLKDPGLSKEEKLTYQTIMGSVINNFGFYYDDHGNIPTALLYYHKSLKIREEIGDKEGMAQSYNNIGAVYHFMEDYDQALDYYQKSLAIEKQLNDTVGMSRSYGNIGVVMELRGFTDEAMENMKEAVRLREIINDIEGMASGYINLGIMLKKMGKTDEAIEYYHKGLKLHKEIQNAKGIATTLYNLGNLHLEKGETNAAQKYLEESLYIAEKDEFLGEIQDASKLLSGIYELKGDYKQSLKMYKLFMEMRDSIKNEEALKATIQLQAKYEYEKKSATDSIKNAEAEKIHLANLEAEKAISEKHKTEANSQRKQKTYLFIGLGLVALFGMIMFNRFKITQRQKNIINDQKKVVEQQKFETEKQKAYIEKQHLELEETHKEISDSIKYAERLQLAILPSPEALHQHLKDGFVLFLPKDVVSGDFYWMQKIDDMVLFAAADCTGHGVPGAMVSVVCSNALNRTVKEFGITEPAAILNKTRELVIETFARSGKDVKDGMDIALCSLQNDRLIFAGANNPLWIVRKKELIPGNLIDQRGTEVNETFGLIDFKSNKQPVGLYEGMSPFGQTEITLHQGDSIYIFTDGFADQFGGTKNKKLMYRPFKKLLLSLQDLEMNEQKEKLQEFFINWKGTHEQVDDICIIGVRV